MCGSAVSNNTGFARLDSKPEVDEVLDLSGGEVIEIDISAAEVAALTPSKPRWFVRDDGVVYTVSPDFPDRVIATSPELAGADSEDYADLDELLADLDTGDGNGGLKEFDPLALIAAPVPPVAPPDSAKDRLKAAVDATGFHLGETVATTDGIFIVVGFARVGRDQVPGRRALILAKEEDPEGYDVGLAGNVHVNEVTTTFKLAENPALSK